ncbi:MAG: hypothetical protein HYY30_05370 [Chloroflexi bacterium]|nr:hypothetical protein [Chloroflexota bacterium]
MLRLDERSRETLRNCHVTLKWMWIVLMGFALKESIETFLYRIDSTGHRFLRNLNDYDWVSVGVFLVFLVTLLRFFHGDSRYLDRKYLEMQLDDFNPNGFRSGKRFADMNMLLIHGIIFYALGVSQRDPVRFFAIYAGLLLFNSVWLVIAWRMSNERRGERGEVRGAKESEDRFPLYWAKNNLVHFGAFVLLFFVASSSYDEWPFRLAVLALGASNCFFDYFLTWRYYFPKLKAEGEAESMPVETVLVAGSQRG